MSDPGAAPIRVLVVEDDRPFREGLASLFTFTPGFELVGAFGAIEEALARYPPPPDVILCDIHLPGIPGSEGVAKLLARWPEAVALMLTVFEDESWVFESLCHGAVGYLLKRTPPVRILDAVREAGDGGSPISPDIARKLVRVFQQQPPAPRLEASLGEQETRLLALLAGGHSYQTAADELEISINTVRKHIRSVYEKLQVHTKSEAVSKALRAGLL